MAHTRDPGAAALAELEKLARELATTVERIRERAYAAAARARTANVTWQDIADAYGLGPKTRAYEYFSPMFRRDPSTGRTEVLPVDQRPERRHHPVR